MKYYEDNPDMVVTLIPAGIIMPDRISPFYGVLVICPEESGAYNNQFNHPLARPTEQAIASLANQPE